MASPTIRAYVLLNGFAYSLIRNSSGYSHLDNGTSYYNLAFKSITNSNTSDSVLLENKEDINNNKFLNFGVIDLGEDKQEIESSTLTLQIMITNQVKINPNGSLVAGAGSNKVLRDARLTVKGYSKDTTENLETDLLVSPLVGSWFKASLNKHDDAISRSGSIIYIPYDASDTVTSQDLTDHKWIIIGETEHCIGLRPTYYKDLLGKPDPDTEEIVENYGEYGNGSKYYTLYPNDTSGNYLHSKSVVDVTIAPAPHPNTDPGTYMFGVYVLGWYT